MSEKFFKRPLPEILKPHYGGVETLAEAIEVQRLRNRIAEAAANPQELENCSSKLADEPTPAVPQPPPVAKQRLPYADDTLQDQPERDEWDLFDP